MEHSRTLLYESVLDVVKARITDGTYRPGQKLPSVKALAGEIGVGISTVREGIRVLESLGLVQMQHGRGIFVTSDTRLLDNPEEVVAISEDSMLLCILEARRIFEPEAAALAAERATAEQVQAIMEAARDQERLIRQSDADPFPADMALHRLIAEAAQNPVLLRMVRSVDELLLDGRRRTGRIMSTYEKSIHYHYLIAHCIENRDPRQARSLMLEHITDLTNDVLNYLKHTTTEVVLAGRFPNHAR